MSSSQINSRRCPNLGLESDPYTTYSYPTPNHYCAKAIPSEGINQDYQLKHCLSERHQQCPLYLGESQAPLPEEAKLQTAPILPHNTNKYLLAAALVGLVLLVFGFLLLIATQF